MFKTRNRGERLAGPVGRGQRRRDGAVVLQPRRGYLTLQRFGAEPYGYLLRTTDGGRTWRPAARVHRRAVGRRASRHRRSGAFLLASSRALLVHHQRRRSRRPVEGDAADHPPHGSAAARDQDHRPCVRRKGWSPGRRLAPRARRARLGLAGRHGGVQRHLHDQLEVGQDRCVRRPVGGRRGHERRRIGAAGGAARSAANRYCASQGHAITLRARATGIPRIRCGTMPKETDVGRRDA